MIKCFFIKGECVIETGFFFFNTEAHPVDGGSLECCQSLRRKDTDDDPLSRLDVDNLLSKYVSVNSGEEFPSERSMKKDYEQFKKNSDTKKGEIENKIKQLCQRIGNDSVHKEFIVNSMKLYLDSSSAMTCSMNDYFNLRMQFYNTETYFP